jgi:hypothetical protein
VPAGFATEALVYVEADIGQNADLEDLLAELRPTLPAHSRTAQAIDRQEPFESIAFTAIDDGYIDFADRLNRFMEIRLRRGM